MGGGRLRRHRRLAGCGLRRPPRSGRAAEGRRLAQRRLADPDLGAALHRVHRRRISLPGPGDRCRAPHRPSPLTSPSTGRPPAARRSDASGCRRNRSGSLAHTQHQDRRTTRVWPEASRPRSVSAAPPHRACRRRPRNPMCPPSSRACGSSAVWSRGRRGAGRDLGGGGLTGRQRLQRGRHLQPGKALLRRQSRSDSWPVATAVRRAGRRMHDHPVRQRMALGGQGLRVGHPGRTRSVGHWAAPARRRPPASGRRPMADRRHRLQQRAAVHGRAVRSAGPRRRRLATPAPAARDRPADAPRVPARPSAAGGHAAALASANAAGLSGGPPPPARPGGHRRRRRPAPSPPPAAAPEARRRLEPELQACPPAPHTMVGSGRRARSDHRHARTSSTIRSEAQQRGICSVRSRARPAAGGHWIVAPA